MFYSNLGSAKIWFVSSETFSAVNTGWGKLNNCSSLSSPYGYLASGKRERAEPASRRHWLLYGWSPKCGQVIHGTPLVINSKVPPIPQCIIPTFIPGWDKTSIYGIHDDTQKFSFFSGIMDVSLRLQITLQLTFLRPS